MVSRIVTLSDTHNAVPANIPAGDVLVHCGDFTNHGREHEVVAFLEWFAAQPHKHKLVVPGNHEVGFDTPAGFIKAKALFAEANVELLIDEARVIDGVKFYGTPYCNGDRAVMWKWAFYVEHDQARADMWQNIPDDTDVLLTHAPPRGILDKYMNQHLGCPELAKRVSVVKPILHVFGHIHSAHGRHWNAHTEFINAAYNRAQKPLIFDI